jgi:hypothetical protein
VIRGSILRPQRGEFLGDYNYVVATRTSSPPAEAVAGDRLPGEVR